MTPPDRQTRTEPETRTPGPAAPDAGGRVAIITGASMGLGRALAARLALAGWHVVVDARDGARLARAVAGWPPGSVTALPGDVTDPDHRRALVGAARAAGPLRLLVNNASALGPSPQPTLADYPADDLRRVYEVDVLAPLALTQLALPELRRGAGCVLNVSSDAAVQAYPGWGGYGSAKAALDQLTAVLAAEEPALAVHAVDPGDMATDLHQQAFPGEDISDRATPESVVPALLRLLAVRPPSGRYRAVDLTTGFAADLAADAEAPGTSA
jgi:NAD(P)-dependent dehydrogenase (short-subunit alcohol dehydrogenase family)